MTTYFIAPSRRQQMRRMMERSLDERWNERQGQVLFPVDLKVEKDDYVLTALLPGLRPEDLDIEVINETVSLKGEFKDERAENESYLLAEIPAGSFRRMITLPERVDSSKAEASMENGVLVLRLPKAEEARPKTIKISGK